MSERLHLSKSIVSRMATTFVSEGVLEKDELTHRYRLGAALLELGLIAGELHPVLRASEEVVKQLRERTGRSSHLMLRDGDDCICLTAQTAGDDDLPSAVGARVPLTACVSGLTILAAVAAHHPAPDASLKTLRAIERNGFACAEEPSRPGIVSVACPVFNALGDVVAAVGVSGAAYTWHQEARKTSVAHVARAAMTISARLR